MEKIEINVNGEQKEIIVREGRAPEIHVYHGFQYIAESTESIIALTKSKGNQPNVVIAYDKDGVDVILDDTVTNRKKDTVTYRFMRSRQYEEWRQILTTKGASFDQKTFLEFLRRREDGEIADIEPLLANVQNFKFVTNITGDFSYDDRSNYTFAIKVGDSESTVKLPRYIYASIELYNESNLKQDIEIEVEVIKPRGEGEKPMFQLSCPKFARYDDNALKNEIATIKQELVGYLIVAGKI